MSKVLMPSHLACAKTVAIESPYVSWNSRQSEVSTQAESPGISGSAGRLSVHAGTPDVRQKSRPMSGVPTPTVVLAGCLTAHVGSPDVRRKFRPSEVSMFAGSFDIDLHARTSDLV